MNAALITIMARKLWKQGEQLRTVKISMEEAAAYGLFADPTGENLIMVRMPLNAEQFDVRIRGVQGVWRATVYIYTFANRPQCWLQRAPHGQGVRSLQLLPNAHRMLRNTVNMPPRLRELLEEHYGPIPEPLPTRFRG